MYSFARRNVPGIGIARLDNSGRSFSPHFHDEFVLSINIRGRERIRLDRQDLEAGEGEITLYNPGQVQSSECFGDEWQFLSLYVAPTVLADAFDLSPDTVFDRPVLAHAGAARCLESGISRALERDIPEAEAHEQVVQALDQLLALAGSRQAPGSRHLSPALGRVADRLRDTEPTPTLAELAGEADLTPVQLVRAFARAYGLPPFTWAANRRVNEARVRLERGESPAHVAADLGFADQAHLTRRFRALYGVPPGRWRQG